MQEQDTMFASNRARIRFYSEVAANEQCDAGLIDSRARVVGQHAAVMAVLPHSCLARWAVC
jgi:hypothetical protein